MNRQDHVGRILGQNAEDDSADAPPVTPALIDYLERKFKAPTFNAIIKNSRDAEHVLAEVATYAAYEDITDHLRALLQSQASK